MATFRIVLSRTITNSEKQRTNRMAQRRRYASSSLVMTTCSGAASQGPARELRDPTVRNERTVQEAGFSKRDQRLVQEARRIASRARSTAPADAFTNGRRTSG